MPRANIYINNENFDHYQQEENKSGLVNNLLQDYYKKALNQAREKQAQLLKKGIVSDIDVKLDGNTVKATVTPSREKSLKYAKEKYATNKSVAVCNTHWQPLPCLTKGCKNG